MDKNLCGYDLYKQIKKKNKVDFSTVNEIRQEFKNTYFQINDKNLVTNLLVEAKQRSFAKNEVSLSIAVGLVGYLIGCILDNIVFESIKNLKCFNLCNTIIYILFLCFIAFVLIMGVLWFYNKKFLKHYRNIYTIFILPYEIELLEERLDQLTNGEWSDVSSLPQKEKTSLDDSIDK